MTKLLTALAFTAAFTTAAAAQAPASAAAPAQTPAPDAMSKELAAMQGTWLLTSVNDQSPADQGVEMALTFTGEKYQQLINGTVGESGTFKIDPSKKPMTFDLNIQVGDDAGSIQLGIVEVTGDDMKGMFAAPGDNTRPADFMSAGAAITFTAKKEK
jgi:uncharacterized protein (TIGR03067 family)